MMLFTNFTTQTTRHLHIEAEVLSVFTLNREGLLLYLGLLLDVGRIVGLALDTL